MAWETNVTGSVRASSSIGRTTSGSGNGSVSNRLVPSYWEVEETDSSVGGSMRRVLLSGVTVQPSASGSSDRQISQRRMFSSPRGEISRPGRIIDRVYPDDRGLTTGHGAKTGDF